MSHTEIIPIVDYNDEVLLYKLRHERIDGEICRVSACWITDDAGHILLAQRSYTKKYDSGKRGAAAAGTVGYDETYMSNIIKEMAEEIGLTVCENDLILGPKYYRPDKYHVQWHTHIYTGDKSLLIHQQSEVEQLKRYTPDEVYMLVTQNSELCTPGLAQAMEIFAKK